jgi:DNA replication and repair protein RecF
LFLEEFRRYVLDAYADLVGGREEPEMSYMTVPDIMPTTSIAQTSDGLLGYLKERQSEECRRGLSLVGPHRDDITFELDGFGLQKYASQGQHKTFLIALKLAEFRYLREKREENPILLFDDVFSELDDERSRRLLRQIDEVGQTIVTTTEENILRDGLKSQYRHFLIEAGTCRPISIHDGKETTATT